MQKAKRKMQNFRSATLFYNDIYVNSVVLCLN